MKTVWILAIAACATLCASAVWMGGLNQDEGWYLYAANLVAEGKLPYRDFFFTQGPVMPIVYSFATGFWKNFGILGARLFTLILGLAGVLLSVATAAKLAKDGVKSLAALTVFLLLGTNLYHLYYIAIPKTYALASLFVSLAFFLLASARGRTGRGVLLFSTAAGLSIAFAAATRISLGAILPVAGLWFLFTRQWISLVGLVLGGLVGLAVGYGPFLVDVEARVGLLAAEGYHASRGGSDLVWVVGSFSRLARWYLPLFAIAGAGIAARFFSRRFREIRLAGFPMMMLFSFLAVLLVQMSAPFPYEDYQVPVMALATVAVAVCTADAIAEASSDRHWLAAVLVMFFAFGVSFGSPLLEKWSTNGQDRFWTRKKDCYELAQLRRVADQVERLDPGGKTLLTQDLYLAIETGRSVPKGLEMGPFAMLSPEAWRSLLDSAPCPVAALSAYSFAIVPPECEERSVEQQVEFWGILKRHYELVGRESDFGQNATPLLLLKRK